MGDDFYLEDAETPMTDRHIGGERLHIRHRHPMPSRRGGLTLEVHDDGVWICAIRGRRGQGITLRPDEVRQARDWLTAWLEEAA